MSKKVVKRPSSSVIYFDNNGTTTLCPPAKKTYIDWLSCYNASSNSKIAKPAKEIIDKATDAILAHCEVSAATHTAVFTSGGSESNCFIIRACVKAYKKKLIEKGNSLVPHIVASAIEHHSSLECLNDLENNGEIELTLVQPTIYGNILPKDVESAIKPTTCLITIMFANNEIPVINNISDIGLIAHKNHIPLHSDCVQLFGKYKFNAITSNVDAISASAHKFYGPKGVGVLILNNKLIEGYQLTAEINGSQQHGLRGGTENIPAIASMAHALKWAFVDRKLKNQKLLVLRNRCLELLGKTFKFGDYQEYADNEVVEGKTPLELVSLGPPEDAKDFILPNTILISVAKNKGKPFCNVVLVDYLDKRGVVVSVGSACLTSNPKASHVLTAIGAPPVIKRGVVRISFGDGNTIAEVSKFVSLFKEGVMKQCVDIRDEIEKPI